jgi:hypothetical protein
VSFQLFPVLEPAIEAALRASIKRWGVLVPVAIDMEGRILDGHHRVKIADELGIDYPTHVVAVNGDEDARQVALTLNADRRQLQPEQRREIVADLRAQGHSLRAIAGAVGVDPKTIRNDLSTGDRSPVDLPARITGLDGRSRPATRPTPTPVADEPDPVTEDELFAIIDEVGDDPDVIEQACAEAVESRRLPSLPTKPDLGGGISHPARYSTPLIGLFADLLDTFAPDVPLTILDPFAGTGRIHELREIDDRFHTVGNELEPEWAQMSPHTVVGDALDLDWDDGAVDAIVTSPTYGNRLADHHNASDPETRRSYTHDLGRPLGETNSGAIQWGDDYKKFHSSAWEEAMRVLRSGGLFVLNIKDHIRGGKIQDVTAWHVDNLMMTGRLELVAIRTVPLPGIGFGANAEARVPVEYVFVFRKDPA